MELRRPSKTDSPEDEEESKKPKEEERKDSKGPLPRDETTTMEKDKEDGVEDMDHRQRRRRKKRMAPGRWPSWRGDLDIAQIGMMTATERELRLWKRIIVCRE